MNKEKTRVKTAQPATTTTTKSINNLLNGDVSTDDNDIKQMVGGCCVCGDDIAFDNNLLVYCDGAGCQVAVHQGCYGIVNIPEGDWYCKRCDFIQSKLTDSTILTNETDNQICCMLCPMKEGALKRTETGKWAHVICGLYIPEISFGSVKTMEPIITKDVRLDRLDKKCSICELSLCDTTTIDSIPSSSSTATPSLLTSNEIQTNNLTSINYVSNHNIISTTKYTTGHVCVQCNNKTGCKLWFHVTCAQMNGLLCEDLSTASSNSVTYSVYCKNHFKASHSDIRRIPAFNMFSSKTNTSKSSKFVLNKLDKQKDTKRKTIAITSAKETHSDNSNIKKKTRMSITNDLNSDKLNTNDMSLSIENKDKKRVSRSNSTINQTDSDQKKQETKKLRNNSVTSNESKKSLKTKESEAKKEDLDSKIKRNSKLKSIKTEKNEINQELEMPVSIKEEQTAIIDESKPQIPDLAIKISNEMATSVQIEPEDEKSNKRKQRNSIDELQIQPPSSSSTTSSNTVKPTSSKSPSQKRQRKSIETKPSQPLTPPPSVPQDLLIPIQQANDDSNKQKDIDIFGNRLNITNKSETIDSSFIIVKPSTSYDKTQTDNCSKTNKVESNEFPKTLEELLMKQWDLGTELVNEQSKKFDVFNLLNILSSCKKENEELEKKILELEKTHENLLNLNQKLNIPIVKNDPIETQQIKKTSPPRQLSQHNLSAVSAASTPTTTPVKQNILQSASPVSISSSPHNVSSPLNNKNNIINNTSINNNINVISHPENCFYNLNSINKNGLKNMNVNYASNNTNNPSHNNYLDLNNHHTTTQLNVSNGLRVDSNQQQATSSSSSIVDQFPLLNQFNQHSHLQQQFNNFNKNIMFNPSIQQQHQQQISKQTFPIDQYELYNYYLSITKNLSNNQTASNDLTSIPMLQTSNTSPNKQVVAALQKAILESTLTNKI